MRYEARHRRDGDQRSPSLDEVGDRRATDEERPEEIDAEHSEEAVRVSVDERAGAARPRVQHQPVESAERIDRLAHGALGIGGDGGVGDDREPTDLSCDGLHGLAPASHDANVPAVCREAPCHRRADPRAAARDECDRRHSSFTVSRSSTV